VRTTLFLCAALPAAIACLPGSARASSHMDAPLITLDDAANTTDVYAFVSSEGSNKYLTTALAVYPFEEPGIGPNKHNFDDRVAYGIHVAVGQDLAAGRATFSYFFLFHTRYKQQNTILQSYLGVVQNVDDAAQNLSQDYTVYAVDYRTGGRGLQLLGHVAGKVPPNNQGVATPFYNSNGGNGPALDGVATAANLDRYTAQSIVTLPRGYQSFCGQRDDGFYADVGATFDLLSLRNPGQDTQKGFNVHTIVLRIPVAEVGGDQQVVGVYAATYRQQVQVLVDGQQPILYGPYIQVARQGNPLFNEVFVGIADKDRYSRTTPDRDQALFASYATNPELARLLNALVFAPSPIPGIETNRTDLAGIFIPDLIKVDLSTAPCRLAGGGPNHPTNPDDAGFSRLSIFGGDLLFSPLQNTMVPGGWPNGRRFGDDVYDIGVSAVISDLRVNPPVIRMAGDNVNSNDIAYNKVMPYAATPHNGRIHSH
jgi:Domain of unknown function (DUF4331)